MDKNDPSPQSQETIYLDYGLNVAPRASTNRYNVLAITSFLLSFLSCPFLILWICSNLFSSSDLSASVGMVIVLLPAAANLTLALYAIHGMSRPNTPNAAVGVAVFAAVLSGVWLFGCGFLAMGMGK